jgi:hypothetical protein
MTHKDNRLIRDIQRKGQHFFRVKEKGATDSRNKIEAVNQNQITVKLPETFA